MTFRYFSTLAWDFHLSWPDPGIDYTGPSTKMDLIHKASAIKNAILVFAFQTPQHFTYFGCTFGVEFFSGVYYPQDVRYEKVRSALAHWEHGEIETLNPSGIR